MFLVSEFNPITIIDKADMQENGPNDSMHGDKINDKYGVLDSADEKMERMVKTRRKCLQAMNWNWKDSK